MITKNLEILLDGEPIKVQYEHYRVDSSDYTARFHKKGRPKIKWLRRYYKIKHNWCPYSRGGKTIAIVYTGDKKLEASRVVAIGTALCSMSDTFCYEIGRDIALTRALKSLQGKMNDKIGDKK